ncbi:MAG: hypothetical protein HYT16_00920 [DPANN group archaeon]|nr:hypothetical protein [DPANN group archaeon]
MAIEDALADVADTLKYCPVPVIQDAIDCAPILYDWDSGRLSNLIDLGDPDAEDFAMTRGEARTLVDICREFAVAGFASDGAGNGVPVPMAVYEERPSFRERHPRLYKALKIGGIILAVSSLVGLAGCIGDPPEGTVQEKIYHDGPDKNSTLDDKIIFTLADGGNWYWISTTSTTEADGINTTKLNESIEPGSRISFNYNKETGDSNSEKVPYRVTKINWIKSETAYQKILDQNEREKKRSDEKSDRFLIALGLGAAAVISGFITIAYAHDNLPGELAKRRQKRRIKNV